MKIKDLPHIESILESKDNEIDDLKEKLRLSEREKEMSLDTWQLPRFIPANDFRKNLPVPRIEMIHESVQYYGSRWVYGIVRQAHKGMRNGWESKDYVLIPFSMTTTSSEVLVRDGKVDTPFRDKSHVQYDAFSLNLPVFVTCPEKEMFNEIEINEKIKEQFQKDIEEIKSIVK